MDALSSLPSVGAKTALRLALHLVDDPSKKYENISIALNEIPNIKKCEKCNNISDTDLCEICLDSYRNTDSICIVENVRDVMAIEDTQQYNGRYHVLGGVISPLEGIGPDELNIQKLIERLKEEEISELIMGLSPTIEGETTIYYIAKLVKPLAIKVSMIARGVSFGGELEYADEMTIARSIQSRIPYNIVEQ